MSRWYESIDRRPGRAPDIRTTETTITFELGILGGILREEFFIPTPRTRPVIRCDRSGEISLRILEGRSSGV